MEHNVVRYFIKKICELVSFLCERDVHLPSIHALPELLHSYRDYAGINSVKIKELVRWHDRCFTQMVKQFTFVNRRNIIVEQKLIHLQNQFRQIRYDPKSALQRVIIDDHKTIVNQLEGYHLCVKKINCRLSNNLNAFGMSTTSMFDRAKEVCTLKECANCGIDVTDCPKQCGRCKLPHYCSRACQGQHWKQGHNRFCVPVAEQRVERLPEVDDSTNCAVCLEKYTSEMKTLKCGHVLHETCLWLVEMFCDAKVCPICRASL